MSRAVLFSGGEDYTDPWHPFADTSVELASILRADGFTVRTVTRVDDLDMLLQSSDLLVVNAGGGQQAHPHDPRLRSALADHAGGILALHVAATLLPTGDFWEERLGGRWVRGRTMHPARGEMRLLRDADVACADLPTVIETIDEAYSWLRVDADARILFRQSYADEMHPVVWTHVTGGRRSAYCALGHDVEAYESPAVRSLVAGLARWAHGADGARGV